MRINIATITPWHMVQWGESDISSIHLGIPIPGHVPKPLPSSPVANLNIHQQVLSWQGVTNKENASMPWRQHVITTLTHHLPPNTPHPTTSAVYMHQWTGSALVQIMVCRLFGAKPLPETVLVYCQLGNFTDIWIQILKFPSRKCVSKCRLRNGGHFIPWEMR